MKPPWRDIGYELYMAEKCMQEVPGCSVYVGWFDNELVINVPKGGSDGKKEDSGSNISGDVGSSDG